MNTIYVFHRAEFIFHVILTQFLKLTLGEGGVGLISKFTKISSLVWKYPFLAFYSSINSKRTLLMGEENLRIWKMKKKLTYPLLYLEASYGTFLMMFAIRYQPVFPNWPILMFLTVILHKNVNFENTLYVISQGSKK